jgi:hypothetical protein
MNYFLIFSCEILEPQIYFFSRLNWIDSSHPCNPGPGPLVGSTSRPGLITMDNTE